MSCKFIFVGKIRRGTSGRVEWTSRENDRSGLTTWFGMQKLQFQHMFHSINTQIKFPFYFHCKNSFHVSVFVYSWVQQFTSSDVGFWPKIETHSTGLDPDVYTTQNKSW